MKNNEKSHSEDEPHLLAKPRQQCYFYCWQEIYQISYKNTAKTLEKKLVMLKVSHL